MGRLSTEFDVLVVSNFGRGHWLATDLADKRLKVGLVDLSERFARWTPEDREGPFGFYKSEGLQATQLERLTEEDYTESCPQGFVVWLKSGPIETQGPLAQFSFRKEGFPEAYIQYLNQAENLKSDARQNLLGQIRDDDFSKTWLVHLCHQLASTRFHLNSRGSQQGAPLPVFADHMFRRASRRGFADSLAWCESKGVQVFQGAEILDLGIQDRRLESMEVRASINGVLRAKQVVWALTSKETSRLDSRFLEKLYQSDAVEPTWSWVRFRYSIQDNGATQSLPPRFVLLQDIYSPWTHENMMLVQRTVRSDQYDVWVRIPSLQRFQQAYLDQLSKTMLGLLRERLPETPCELLAPPQEYLYPENELGPSCYPVYEPSDLEQLHTKNLKNVFWDGPEYWERSDWNFQLSHHAELSQQVQAQLEKEKPR